MEWLTDTNVWISLLTLTALEIVLGIDNIVFISILTSKLRVEDQPRARFLGLSAALVMRVLLLFAITWIMGLTEPLFEVLGHAYSARDLILVVGGLFLLAKATYEIHDKLEGQEGHAEAGVGASFFAVVTQIMLLDMVFSLDSVLTAIGMADRVGVMIAAVVIAIGVMMVSAGPVADFVERRPTVKMLALSFLLLIGMTLVADGLGQHIPKGYIYFAMGFSLFVEALNQRMASRMRAAPVHLRQRYSDDD